MQDLKKAVIKDILIWRFWSVPPCCDTGSKFWSKSGMMVSGIVKNHLKMNIW